MTGRSRGFGFVTMASAEEAALAVQQLDGFVSAC
jgi:RNA recognition motif-containing protein